MRSLRSAHVLDCRFPIVRAAAKGEKISGGPLSKIRFENSKIETRKSRVKAAASRLRVLSRNGLSCQDAVPYTSARRAYEGYPDRG